MIHTPWHLWEGLCPSTKARIHSHLGWQSLGITPSFFLYSFQCARFLFHRLSVRPKWKETLAIVTINYLTLYFMCACVCVFACVYVGAPVRADGFLSPLRDTLHGSMYMSEFSFVCYTYLQTESPPLLCRKGLSKDLTSSPDIWYWLYQVGVSPLSYYFV